MPIQQKRGRRTRTPSISSGRRSVILLLWGAALIVLISIPLGKIPGISFLAGSLKGLFGLGYYFIPVSLLIGGYLLLSHSETLGSIQAFICCLIPLPAGGLHHAVFCTAETPESAGMSLWETGAVLKSGGVISGGFQAV